MCGGWSAGGGVQRSIYGPCGGPPPAMPAGEGKRWMLNNFVLFFLLFCCYNVLLLCRYAGLPKLANEV